MKESPLREEALGRMCSSNHGVTACVLAEKKLARLLPGSFAAFALLGTRGDPRFPYTLRAETTNTYRITG